MLTTYSLAAFTRELDALVAEHAGRPATVPPRAQPLLERLLAAPDFAPPPVPADTTGHGGRALLHRHPAGLYTVWSMAFGARHATPVHDHNTWGIVGVWRGEEREEKYHRTDDGSHPGYASLTALGTTINRPGTVTLLVPPGDDIHRIWNETDEPAYSIHVYGGLSDTRRAYTFDLDTGRAATWAEDPLGAARLWGLPVAAPDLRTLLGLGAETSDAELVRLLRERLAPLDAD